MFIKYTLIVAVTTMVAASLVGCSNTRYYQYSPHIISNRDTTEIYILNTDLSPGLLSIWLKNPKKPNTKVLVIDSVSFERMSIKSSNTVSTRITGTLSNN
jgi:hypothetical protein